MKDSWLEVTLVLTPVISKFAGLIRLTFAHTQKQTSVFRVYWCANCHVHDDILYHNKMKSYHLYLRTTHEDIVCEDLMKGVLELNAFIARVRPGHVWPLKAQFIIFESVSKPEIMGIKHMKKMLNVCKSVEHLNCRIRVWELGIGSP